MIDHQLAELWKKTSSDFRSGSLIEETASMMPPFSLFDMTCSLCLTNVSETVRDALLALDGDTFAVSVYASSAKKAAEEAIQTCPAWRGTEPVGVFQINALATPTQPVHVPEGLQRYVVVLPGRVVWRPDGQWG